MLRIDFVLNFAEIRCRNFFPFPDHLIASNFTCSTILGSTFTIACRESNHLLLVRNQESEYLLNFCSKSGHWVPADQLSHLRCIERGKTLFSRLVAVMSSQINMFKVQASTRKN